MSEVKWTPVTEILKNLRYSCDFGYWWEWVGDDSGDDADCDNTELLRRIIHSKSADTGFGHLVESIQRHGFNEAGAIGWDGENFQNGHHRFVAAVLLGLDSVPTVDDWGLEWHGCPDAEATVAHYCDHDEYPIEVEV